MEELARLYIKEIVRLHGVPSSIVSDRDPQFNSRFWGAFQKAFGMKLCLSTAYHPQTDGQSERTIQTLEDMLRACVLDQRGSRDRYMPLMEFAYNNSFHASIGMAPYEALYGRKCQYLLCWYESGEASVLGPDLIAETTENIKKNMYFCGYIRLFEILERFGLVAYQVALTPHLSNLHDVFHVSQLYKYTSDEAHVLELESVELRENLTFRVTPLKINDTSVKKLRGKEVSLVKVTWERAGVEEHTWELKSEMRKDYSELFSGNSKFEGKISYLVRKI
ncbi:uncharacterized protein LOC130944432 [Arachis stenosperma]|uniref:uncharacterized protein LOC130944432 n=1 Tax=Arachis stenosperma TaxID=217475 RepID=UPI0025AD23F7|nr:uncharacterized protein LOC130944432 [Arachis stenosperma]